MNASVELDIGTMSRMTMTNDVSRLQVSPRIRESGNGDTRQTAEIKAEVSGLNFFYGKLQALKNINMVFGANQVTAIIGPSGCGKSTLLRCFNRIHDLYPETRYEGKIILQPSGTNVIGPETDPLEMRLRVSMVFQKPNAFPKSVFENAAFGLRLRGVSRQGTRAASRAVSGCGGALGRSEGPVAPVGLHAVWWSTTASLYRSGVGD